MGLRSGAWGRSTELFYSCGDGLIVFNDSALQ